MNENTPLALLTVKQFRELIMDKEAPVIQDNEKEYVYGIAGIRKLFNVSHVTAIKYKDSIIKDAVTQRGRIIITDKEKALELFTKK